MWMWAFLYLSFLLVLSFKISIFFLIPPFAVHSGRTSQSDFQLTNCSLAVSLPLVIPSLVFFILLLTFSTPNILLGSFWWLFILANIFPISLVCVFIVLILNSWLICSKTSANSICCATCLFNGCISPVIWFVSFCSSPLLTLPVHFLSALFCNMYSEKAKDTRLGQFQWV